MGGLKYFHEWGNIEFLTWLAKLRGTVAQSSEFLFRSLAILVTHSLTKSCLLNLIDVTLACGDGNSKLVEVVTVVEVDDEKRVDNSLVQIWKVNFGHKVKFLFGL